jgi:hypothetical protein
VKQANSQVWYGGMGVGVGVWISWNGSVVRYSCMSEYCNATARFKQADVLQSH